MILNFDCFFCYNDREKAGQLLSVQQYSVLLEDLARMQTLFLMLTGWFGDIGNAAHLGGAIAGFGLVKYNRRREQFS